MTTKREWKRRALAAEALVEHLQITLAETADRGIEDWCAGYDQYQEHLTAERDAAIAQRDLARDAAAALEGELHASIDPLRLVLDAPTGPREPWPNVGGGE